MTTYLINHMRLPNDVHNLPTLEYMERIEGTFTPFGGRWLVLDAPVEVLEGHWPGNAVMMEFPDREMAKRWYGSPGYREIIDLRTGNAVSDMVLIDSVGPDFSSAEWAQRMRSGLSGRPGTGGTAGGAGGAGGMGGAGGAGRTPGAEGSQRAAGAAGPEGYGSYGAPAGSDHRSPTVPGR